MATRPIKIAIIGDDSNLRKSLKGATKSVEGFGKRIGKMGFAAGAAFGGVATAVAVTGVKAFQEFQTGMAEVLTLLPEAGAEVFGELSQQTKDFAREFGVLPDKVVPALYSALSAGVPKDNVFEFLEVAQKAAKGGVTDLETAVDGISSVLNSYGAEVISATEASDLMFTAVRLGKTTFEEISGSIFQMAPIASAVGIPFKDLTASIANLTAAGVPTSVAAGQMKMAMAELGKAGSKADVAFRDLTGMGLQQFLEEEGNFASAMITMKEGADEAGISVLDMFGSIEAGQGVLALTADGGQKYIETLQAMSGSSGATEQAFLTMDSTMGASFEKIKANLAVLALDIGERLAPLVAKATDFILEGFEKLKVLIPKIKETVLEWAEVIRRKVTPHITKFREAISKVVDWVRTFIKENPHSALAALGVLVAAVVVPAVMALVAGFFALFSPVILIVGALAALAAGAVYAYENFETFRNIVDAIKDWLVETLWPAMIVVAEGIRDAFWVVVRFFQEDFVPIVEAVADAMTVAFQAVLDFFQDDFVPIVEGVVETLTTIWTTLADFFTTYVEPIITAAIGAIIELFESIWTAVEGVYLLLKGLFTGDMALLWDGLKQTVSGVVTGIIDLFIELPMDILNAAKPLIGKFALIVSDFTVYLFNKILDLIEEIPGKIAEFMSAVGEDMLQLGKDIGGWLIDGIINAITGAAGAIWDALKDAIPGLGDLGGFFGNLFSSGGKGSSTRRTTNAPWERNWDPTAPATGGMFPIMGGVGGEAWKMAASTGFGQSIIAPDILNPDFAAGRTSLPSHVISTPWDPSGRFGVPSLEDIEAAVAARVRVPINVTVNAGLGTDGNQVGDEIVTALSQWERANGSIPITVQAN